MVIRDHTAVVDRTKSTTIKVDDPTKTPEIIDDPNKRAASGIIGAINSNPAAPQAAAAASRQSDSKRPVITPAMQGKMTKTKLTLLVIPLARD
jgi:hypothetical protein